MVVIKFVRKYTCIVQQVMCRCSSIRKDLQKLENLKLSHLDNDASLKQIHKCSFTTCTFGKSFIVNYITSYFAVQLCSYVIVSTISAFTFSLYFDFFFQMFSQYRHEIFKYHFGKWLKYVENIFSELKGLCKYLFGYLYDFFNAWTMGHTFYRLSKA